MLLSETIHTDFYTDIMKKCDISIAIFYRLQQFYSEI